MNRFFLIASLLTFTSLASAQDFQRVAPKTPAPNPNAGQIENAPRPALSSDKSFVGTNLKGVVFVASAASVKGAKSIRGIEIKGVPLLDSPEFRAQVQPYLGQPISINLLHRLAREVVTYYDSQDRPVVSANIPEQDITGGVVQIVVVEGVLGKVRVTCNHWFASDIFKDSVQLRPGEPIYKSELQFDLRSMNVNSFHSTDAVFRPGTATGTTDVWLNVQDRFPLRVYTGYENTGTQATGEDRVLAGFNWGNAFGLDQQLNYQYTASPDFDHYKAQSGSYIVPLPWAGHRLTFFGLYDESKNDVPAPFNSHGRSYQVSGRYTIPLPDFRTYSQEFSFGFDFKDTNNDLEFGGNRVFKNSVDIDQFVLSYNGGLPDRYGSTNLSVDVFLSPGGLMGNNSSADFQTGVPGANASYVYSEMGLTRVTNLPAQFSLFSKISGQVSTGTLFSTETLGAGGFDSVRGYEEREVNGDEGFLMTQEIRSPTVHPLSGLLNLKVDDNLQVLAFSDTGWVSLKNPSPGIDSDYLLSSLGVGVRYNITPYFTMRADYGFQLVRTGLNPDYDSHASIGVTLSY
jgi:hemolysin activation/secretion protein